MQERQRPASRAAQGPQHLGGGGDSLDETRQEVERIASEAEHLLNAAQEAQAKDHVPRGTFHHTPALA